MVNSSLFQREMSDVALKLNTMDKSIRANGVQDIAIQLANSEIKNREKVPHGELNKHLNDAKRFCPTISRSMINTAVLLH